ncbi:hypothetical protein U1Q18_019871 [Sarracenia purpurea var. burkii]
MSISNSLSSSQVPSASSSPNFVANSLSHSPTSSPNSVTNSSSPSSIHSSSSTSSLPIHVYFPLQTHPSTSLHSNSSSPVSPPGFSHPISLLLPLPVSSSAHLQPPISSQSLNTHPMVTRSKSKLSSPIFLSPTTSNCLPSSSSALQLLISKYKPVTATPKTTCSSSAPTVEPISEALNFPY